MEDVAQLQDIKPDAFYDEQAALRNYFYFIDSQGRLFLENTVPKNIATSLKSDQFLNFFFKQLRRNDRVPRRSPDGVIPFEEYPFLSPCGKEKNYVKCADVPLVFHTLAESDDGPTGEVLVYGAQLEVPFDPAQLCLSPRGRMYHPAAGTQLGGLGLVHTHLASELCNNLVVEEDGTFVITLDGAQYCLQQLDFEPRDELLQTHSVEEQG